MVSVKLTNMLATNSARMTQVSLVVSLFINSQMPVSTYSPSVTMSAKEAQTSQNSKVRYTLLLILFSTFLLSD